MRGLLHKSAGAELFGAVTTELNRAQAPTRRMLVDQKGVEKPPAFSGGERDFHVHPIVRAALLFAVGGRTTLRSVVSPHGRRELRHRHVSTRLREFAQVAQEGATRTQQDVHAVSW